MIADYVQVSGLHRARLDPHTLLAHVVDEPLNAAGPPAIITLVDDCQTHGQRNWRLGYAPVSSAVEIARILYRLNQLSPIHRAESLTNVGVSAAAWAFFHGSLQGLVDYTVSVVICPLSFVTGHW